MTGPELFPPDPPVPAEADLTDFTFFPLEFGRLFRSDTWVLGKPEEKLAALHLWCASWHQKPAGSLPDDERILTHLSGAGTRWKALKKHAMKGWVKCSDGRYYHLVVAEKVMEAWAKKIEHRKRTFNARVASYKKQIEAATDVDKSLLQAQLDTLLQAGPLGIVGAVTPPKEALSISRSGSGSRSGSSSSASSLRSEPSSDQNPGDVPSPGIAVWEAYSAAFEERYNVPPVRNGRGNSLCKQLCQRIPAADAPHVAAFYVGHNSLTYVKNQHPLNLLLRDCEGMHVQWRKGRAMTETAARQTDQTAARGDGITELLREKRRVG